MLQIIKTILQKFIDDIDVDESHRTRRLPTLSLQPLIENAVKQIELDKQKEAEGESEAADEDELMEISLFSDDAAEYLHDEAFGDFRDAEDEWADEDEILLQELLAEGEE